MPPRDVGRCGLAMTGGDERRVQPVMMFDRSEVGGRRSPDRDEGRAAEYPQRSAVTAPAELDLSVVIVNWNTRELLRDCLASLQQHLRSVEHEVIVIDNASRDGSAEMVAADFPDVRLVSNEENVGFGRANNQAMRIARGRWFLLLNSDTVLPDDSVSRLFGHVQCSNGVGVAQCRLILPDGRTQHTAYRFPSVRLAALEELGLYKLLPSRKSGSLLLSGYWDYRSERDVDWVAGAFMLMPRAVFERTGGFDESLFMYGEDMEWCYRIRDDGWRIRYYPRATIKHFNHASSEIRWGDERVALCLRRQRDIYRERHGAARASGLMTFRVIGAALRIVYYAVRRRVGPRAEAYDAAQRYTVMSLRALLPLAFRR